MSRLHDEGLQEPKTQDGSPLDLPRSNEGPQDDKVSDRLQQQPHVVPHMASSESMQGSQDRSTATKGEEASFSNAVHPTASPPLALIKRRPSDETDGIQKQDTRSRRRVRFL